MDRRTALAAALSTAWPLSRAQAPRPLTIVIPFAPGGASDIVVRALSDPLAQELGRPIVAENKGGAGGLIAAAAVAHAAPDGQTLLYGNQGQMVVARHLASVNTPDPRSVLAPVSQTARVQFLLVVPTDSRFAGADALVQASRRERLRFGVSGIGAPPHMAAVALSEQARGSIEAVPYQGSAPMLVDLMAGRLDAAFDNVATSLVHVRSGKLRALGVSSAHRVAVAPEISTLAEAGVEGYAYESWHGLFAPRGTPAETIALVAGAVQRSLASSSIRTRLQEAGLDIAVSTPGEFEALIERDAEYWDAMVRKGAIRAS